jgi:hypothetical protein
MNTGHTRAAAWGVRSFRASALLLGALGLLASIAACDDAGFAMIQSHLITDQPEPSSGYSCTQLSASGSTGSGGANDGFWITESQDTDGVVIEWGEGETKLGKRQFSPEFFEAGEMERFIIEAPNGDRFSYMVWGAESCTRCPEQPFTPLPGDLSGCANAVDSGARNADNQTTGDREGNDEANVHAD